MRRQNRPESEASPLAWEQPEAFALRRPRGRSYRWTHGKRLDLMKSFRVLDPRSPADRSAWCEIWDRSPMQLPYAHPGYGDLLRPSDGRLYAAVREDAESTVLYPFVLRPIGDGPRHDITSPYGYGGPLHWGSADAEDVAERFWAGFDQWARSNAVVAEFIRFSLFDDVLPYPGMKRSRNLNFVCELPGTEDELWASLHKKVRQGVRRAQRMGLDIVVDTTNTRIDDFIRIYSGTMARRDSDDWYRFSDKFFDGLLTSMGTGR